MLRYYPSQGFLRDAHLLPHFDNKIGARKYQSANSDDKMGANYRRSLAELVVDSEKINSNIAAGMHLGAEKV